MKNRATVWLLQRKRSLRRHFTTQVHVHDGTIVAYRHFPFRVRIIAQGINLQQMADRDGSLHFYGDYHNHLGNVEAESFTFRAGYHHIYGTIKAGSIYAVASPHDDLTLG